MTCACPLVPGALTTMVANIWRQIMWDVAQLGSGESGDAETQAYLLDSSTPAEGVP